MGLHDLLPCPQPETVGVNNKTKANQRDTAALTHQWCYLRRHTNDVIKPRGPYEVGENGKKSGHQLMAISGHNCPAYFGGSAHSPVQVTKQISTINQHLYTKNLLSSIKSHAVHARHKDAFWQIKAHNLRVTLNLFFCFKSRA